MKDRIRQIMESLKMTQSEFADYIELAPATLSSIFNGRTRPTLNVVEALKKKIPNINVEWLLFGVGDMHLKTSEADLNPDDSSLEKKAQPYPQNPMLDFDMVQSPAPQNTVQGVQQTNSVRNTRSDFAKEEVKIIDKPQRRVMEIRVFYDDQTWETFVPSRK